MRRCGHHNQQHGESNGMSCSALCNMRQPLQFCGRSGGLEDGSTCGPSFSALPMSVITDSPLAFCTGGSVQEARAPSLICWCRNADPGGLIYRPSTGALTLQKGRDGSAAHEVERSFTCLTSMISDKDYGPRCSVNVGK